MIRCVPEGNPHDLNVSRARKHLNTQPHPDNNTTDVDYVAGIKWIGH